MMKLPRRKFLHLAASAAALPSVSRGVWAQAYPTRPARAIVPFAPGGVTDTFARLMAQKLTEQFGKQVYVENIAGATGNIGTGQVAKAAPDGYTILFAFSSHVVNPTLFARLPYDPINDFKPVTLAVASTTVLTVNPAVPAKTVKELVELIKANPGKYSFSSAGAGTQAHLAGEQFRLSLGLDLVHVPFGGGGPAVAAVVAGHTPMSFGSPQAAMQHVKEGTVRALAVTSKTRSQLFPDVTDHDRGGLSADRRRQLGGHPCSRRHAGGHRHGVAPRECENPRAAGHEGSARRARLRRGREHAGGVRHSHQDRDRPVGRGDPRGQYQARIGRT